jgi:hypothetical protein
MTDRPPCPLPIPFDVCGLFEKLTLDLWFKGWEHYSARAVMHQIRWHRRVHEGDRTFKCNNNWTPALARWFRAAHPETGDFFHLRRSPHLGGPRHDPEDYMGPYDDGQPDERKEWEDFNADC